MANSGKRSMRTRWFLFCFIVILGLVLFAGRHDGEKNTGHHASHPPQASLAAPAMLSDQKAFLEAVRVAQQNNSAAANDMQRGGILRSRNSRIFSRVPGLKASNWIGTVQTVRANSEGKGVLGIRLGNDVYVKTWNNAL